MRTRVRRGKEYVVYKLRLVAPNTKKRGAHTHAAFRLSLEAARARSQADHVRLRGVAAFGYNAAIASLGRGDECIGSWHVGIEVSRHEGVQGSAGLTVHPRRACISERLTYI